MDTQFDTTINIQHYWTGKDMTVPTLTAGKARRILLDAKEKGLTGMSSNNSFTKRRAFDTLWVDEKKHPDDEPINVAIARSIVREFGS
jgi:hypothetical protein